MTTRIVRAHRFRLDLTKNELAEIERLATARRQAWNWGLALVKDTLGLETAPDEELVQLSGYGPSRLLDRFSLINTFNAAKSSLDWTENVPTRIFEYAFEDLGNALAAFFAARKEKKHRRVGFPRFIRKEDLRRTSFTVRGAIRLEDGGLKFSGFKKPLMVRGSTVRLRWELSHCAGVIKEATVRREGRGHWSLSVVIEREARAELEEPLIKGALPVGLDLGLHTLATFSDGTSIENPRHLQRRSRRLRFLVRALARSQRARGQPALLPAIGRHAALLEAWAAQPTATRGSKPAFPALVLPAKSHRQQKKETALARAQTRVASSRRTGHGQIAAAIIPHYWVLGIENLATANLLQNHCLAATISDAGWASLVSAIETRAEDQGALVIKAGRFFASSQRCSHCGHKNPTVKDLHVRSWVCSECGTLHQRDLNAAINLIPTRVQIDLALSAHIEKQARYQRRREQISKRACTAAETKAQRRTEKQTRLATQQARNAREKARARAALATDIYPATIVLTQPINRRPAARATLNRAPRTGQTVSLAPARSATRRSATRSLRPETRTGNPGGWSLLPSNGSP